MESTSSVKSYDEPKQLESLNKEVTNSLESAATPAKAGKKTNMSTYIKMCKTSNSSLFVTPVRTVAYQAVVTPSSQTRTNGYKGKKLFDLLKEMETQSEVNTAATQSESRESMEETQRSTRRSIDYVKTPIKSANDSRPSIRIML